MGESQISHAGKALVKSFIEIKGMRKERGKEIQRDTKDGGGEEREVGRALLFKETEHCLPSLQA